MHSATDLHRLVLEQAADALIYSNRDGLIECWNTAASHLFGYTASQAIGQSLDLIIPPHLRAAHWAGYNAALEHGQSKHHGKPMLTRAVHKDGHALYVEMTFALVKDANNYPIGAVAIARDGNDTQHKKAT